MRGVSHEVYITYMKMYRIVGNVCEVQHFAFLRAEQIT